MGGKTRGEGEPRQAQKTQLKPEVTGQEELADYSPSPLKLLLGPFCLESLPILWSDLVRVHPGRPAAIPTATGWDEELRARTAGVRLPRQGHSESSSRTDPSVCPIMLRHRYR